jgi:hypothetical protein
MRIAAAKEIIAIALALLAGSSVRVLLSGGRLQVFVDITIDGNGSDGFA